MQNVDHIHFDSIDSTHLYARGKVHELKPNQWSLCTANSQESGMGTKNSKWISPADVNIYATYSFLIPKPSADKIFFIPQITCLQIVKLLQDLGIKASIKWVNDVLVRRKKISGVLCESFSGSHGDNIAVVVSIGLNVNADASHLGSVRKIATSMKLEANKEYNLQDLLMRLSGYLFKSVSHLMEYGFARDKDLISQKLEKYDGQTIILRSITGLDVRGVIKGIDEKGGLILQAKNDIYTYFEGSIITL